MASEYTIKIESVVPRSEAYIFKNPINWTIAKGEHWAVIGANGAGKSQLIDIVLGKQFLRSGQIHFADNEKSTSFVKYVAFTDIYSLININNSYYQQRWNTGDEQNAPLVADLFQDIANDWVDTLVEAFSLTSLMSKRVNMLSSGELRKTLIILSLQARPKVLILDNPYIGLDTDSRLVLNKMLEQLIRLKGIQIITVVTQIEDISPVITHVLPVKDKQICDPRPLSEFLADKEFIETLFERKNSLIIHTNTCRNQADKPAFEDALIFNNVHIKYGSRTILENIYWQVKKGEQWLLWGKNGSGKSTLLSLVFGDNPQAYANDIVLFDRKRGTGESIWDIKRRIGYISPEISLYYRKNISCLDVVCSGFFDTIGSPRKCNEEQIQIALSWMNKLGIEHLKESFFLSASTGERQLTLLARLFVKNPDLLVLDEPLHGLDQQNKELVKQIIEDYCTDNRSLIYVTHYEDEIPKTITNRFVLTKID